MHRAIKFPIKGTFYYSAELALDLNLIHNGLILQMRPEPSNKYDTFAIQIWLINPHAEPENNSGLLLGYVPKMMSKNLSKLLTANPPNQILITEHARLGKRIEIDCLLEIDLAWLSYVYLSALALFATQLHRFRRFTSKLFS